MRKKMLVVDDEKGILDAIKRFYDSNGYEVDTALSVEDGIKMINSTFYPVVISDICFPGKKTGVDVLKAAKKRSSKTEVIMITGYASIQSAVETMKLGAYDYITKPFDFNELKTRIERVYELRDMEEKLDDTHESLRAVEDSAGESIAALNSKIEEQEAMLDAIGAAGRKIMKTAKKDSPEYKTAEKILASLKGRGK